MFSLVVHTVKVAVGMEVVEIEHQILSTSSVAVHRGSDDASDVYITSVLDLTTVTNPPGWVLVSVKSLKYPSVGVSGLLIEEDVVVLLPKVRLRDRLGTVVPVGTIRDVGAGESMDADEIWTPVDALRRTIEDGETIDEVSRMFDPMNMVVFESQAEDDFDDGLKPVLNAGVKGVEFCQTGDNGKAGLEPVFATVGVNNTWPLIARVDVSNDNDSEEALLYADTLDKGEVEEVAMVPVACRLNLLLGTFGGGSLFVELDVRARNFLVGAQVVPTSTVLARFPDKSILILGSMGKILPSELIVLPWVS
ncbi:hypothetical protein NHQ30_004033 [Ciborinia camelliae]|nr:hypothetical protein NHQ30_004033 [Ciborinia camelliae]